MWQCSSSGDEVSECLSQLAEEESLSGAQITAIGAFRDAILAFFDWETKAYEEIPVSEQVEVLSLNGDIALDEYGRPKLHLHTVLGRRDGSTIGGHLMGGHVRPTLEVMITETPAFLRRVHDPHSGLALIRLDESWFESVLIALFQPLAPKPPALLREHQGCNAEIDDNAGDVRNRRNQRSTGRCRIEIKAAQ